MKHILCFGDSNTYGLIPFGGRYDDKTRWPMRIAGMLGPDYQIHEEGLCARTTSIQDPVLPYRSAMDYIYPCLESHIPVDLTILMLGSNDLKEIFEPSVEKITASIKTLVEIILEQTQAPVLLASPPLLRKEMPESPCSVEFSPRSVEVSHHLAPSLQALAEEMGVAFLDAGAHTEVSLRDCLHLTEKGHHMLADAMYHKVCELLQKSGG